MDDVIFWLAYIGYISLSSVIAYPLLKWKSQHPKSLGDVCGMIFFNALIFGVLPLLPFLMRYSPVKGEAGPCEFNDYYERRKIWIWNK